MTYLVCRSLTSVVREDTDHGVLVYLRAICNTVSVVRVLTDHLTGWFADANVVREDTDHGDSVAPDGRCRFNPVLRIY